MISTAVLAAHALTEPTVYGWTPGRVAGSAAALVALAGVIIGGIAIARPGNPFRATVALAGGLTGIVGGGLVVALAKGGPGAGYGIVGGYVAIAIGLIATILGWMARARSRRTS
jgi:hypothetical protein